MNDFERCIDEWAQRVRDLQEELARVQAERDMLRSLKPWHTSAEVLKHVQAENKRLLEAVEQVAKNNEVMWQSHKETVEIQAKDILSLQQQLAAVTQERDEHKRWREKLADDLHDRETALYAMTRKYDAYTAVAEAHEEVLTRERDRYKDLLEGKRT